MRLFLGIDVGTSFIKAAAFDPDSLQLHQSERVPFPPFLTGLPALHREVDPTAVLHAVERLIAGFPQCERLWFCGQMHGFVLVNPRGEPVSNYVSWLDQRVSPAEFRDIESLLTDQERLDVGNECRSSIAVSQLYWLQKHGALPSGDVTPVSIADFVASRLNGTPPVMEPTQAAAFGALRLSNLTWHDEVIGKLGLQSLRWPEVLPFGAAPGLSIGDQQAALAGALLADRELSLNIGTGSQVAFITDSLSKTDVQVRPYFGGRFIRTITHIPAGRALGALVTLFTELGGSPADAWTRIEAAVAATPATDLQASLTFFPGPCGDRGFLRNLHEGNLSIGHVFRAAFESMAANYRDCARRLDPHFSAERIVFSGGVARRSAILREVTASRLELPYRLSPHPEDTLYGLMVLVRNSS
jgi:sugar (pentulose or hexulose) kinase